MNGPLIFPFSALKIWQIIYGLFIILPPSLIFFHLALPEGDRMVDPALGSGFP